MVDQQIVANFSEQKNKRDGGKSGRDYSHGVKIAKV